MCNGFYIDQSTFFLYSPINGGGGGGWPPCAPLSYASNTEDGAPWVRTRKLLTNTIDKPKKDCCAKRRCFSPNINWFDRLLALGKYTGDCGWGPCAPMDI